MKPETISKTDWALFVIITVLLGLSMFDRNVFTSIVVATGWIIMVVAMVTKKVKQR